eukprot:4382406-Pyramimonas_sp.AAC.2
MGRTDKLSLPTCSRFENSDNFGTSATSCQSPASCNFASRTTTRSWVFVRRDGRNALGSHLPWEDALAIRAVGGH